MNPEFRGSICLRFERELRISIGTYIWNKKYRYIIQ